MPFVPASVFRSFDIVPRTVAFGTAIVRGIPPYPGPAGNPPLLAAAPLVANPYALITSPAKIPSYAKANFTQSGAVTRISQITYTTAGTAHTVTIMRPLNFTTVSSAALNGQAVINVNNDPGIFSTSYAYPTPGNAFVTNAADVAIAGGHYCAYQLSDGTWFFDTVASVSGTAITMTTNVPGGTSGVGVSSGALFYFFGAVTSVDPATGILHWQVTTTVSTRQQWGDGVGTLLATTHKNDPMILVANNVTATGFLEGGSGYYSPV